MKNLFFLLFLLLIGGQVVAQNPCPQPAPASITIYDIGPDQAKADWPLVSTAARYRVELIHVPSNSTVSVGYYPVPGASFNSLASSTIYEVRISSSACNSNNQADYGDPIAQRFETSAIIIGDIVYGFDPLSTSVPPNTINQIWACIPWINPAYASEENVLHIRVDWGTTGYREFELVCQTVNNVSQLRVAEYNPVSNDNYEVVIINNGFQAKIKYLGVDRILIGAPMLASANGGYGRVPIQILDDVTILRIDPLCTGISILDDVTEYCSAPYGGERDLDQVSPALGLTAAPNPFTDLLTLRMPAETDGPVDVLLLNALGQVVRSRHFDAVNASERLEIDLETSDLAPGMYLLSVQTRGGRQTQTLYRH
jgi:hypothetical protein